MADGHGGARIGAGRKSESEIDELRTLLAAAVPLADRRAILKKMGERAKKGDLQATKWLFEQIYGRPNTRPEEKPDEAERVPLLGYRVFLAPTSGGAAIEIGEVKAGSEVEG